MLEKTFCISQRTLCRSNNSFTFCKAMQLRNRKGNDYIKTSFHSIAPKAAFSQHIPKISASASSTDSRNLQVCGIALASVGAFGVAACEKDDSLYDKFIRKVNDLSKDVGTSDDLLDSFREKLNDMIDSGVGGQITWGFCMGICSGYALKKVSKVGAVALGSLFILLQAASYTGYINVDYKKMERDVTHFFDFNSDGKLDSKDLQALYEKVMEVLTFSLPAGSGFATGFVVGFKSG